jgi:hypothetical protein
MGKATSISAACALLLAAVIVPLHLSAVRAQSSPPVSCSGQPLSTPMQGHYTGQWHSDGDYHFYALGHDIDLKITIDGSVDALVDSSGHVTGVVQGKVDAPLTHDGQHDVSSGKGTISGALTGLFEASGVAAVLAQPVILMHWGTFGAGGYTADRYITMPDYSFPISTSDCISAQGSISETNFPVQYIVADFQGNLAQVPGIGAATGTWQIASDKSGEFYDLSQQVDTFINQANAFLTDTSATLTPTLVDHQVSQPLRSLESTIRRDPDVSRCLLDRLGDWQSVVLKPLLAQAASLATSSDLPTLRRSGDLLRSAHLLNLDCSLNEGPASSSLLAAGRSMLDRAISSRSWPDAALSLREILLMSGNVERPALQQEVNADLHALLQSTSANAALLDIARVSYALGDTDDSRAALKRATARLFVSAREVQHKKKHKKKKARPKPKSTPTPTPTVTPTLPPMPPRTLEQQISAGIIKLQASVTIGTSPTFSWSPVIGVTRYVVAVTSADSKEILWAWAGSGTSVTFGDTSIPGMANSADDAWPALPDGTSFTWSVLALNAPGQIVGASFRAKA